jgi:hypothetical protein
VTARDLRCLIDPKLSWVQILRVLWYVPHPVAKVSCMPPWHHVSRFMYAHSFHVIMSRTRNNLAMPNQVYVFVGRFRERIMFKKSYKVVRDLQ